jgi:hypothetical protein
MPGKWLTGRIMKIILTILIILIAVSCFAQNFEAIKYFSQDRTLTPPLYQFLIDYYTSNINDIESVKGKTTIEIPQKIKVKAKVRTVVVEGNIVQYIRHPNGKDVILYELDSDNVVIDFKNKDWKVEKDKTDKDSFLKPSDLKDKVKKRDDKDKKKNK